jgi:hypothetical protein
MTTKEYQQSLKTNLDEALSLSIRKNKDYADHDSPFKNFELSAQVAGVPVAKGIMIRIMDKMTRMSHLLEREAVIKDEKIEDTIKDAINYLNIMLVYLSNK